MTQDNAKPKGAPKVSVLVPVYNGGRFLGECLDSILAQDFADMEILLVDDASTDGSAKTIEQYAVRDPRLRYWRNSRTLGLTANSNACLRVASGEYIKFVHQDDKLLCRSAIRKLVAALDAHPGVVLAACRQHVTGTPVHPIILSDQVRLLNGQKLILAGLERNTNLVGQPSLTLFRRSHAARGFDERFTGHMDIEMWCHLLEQGDFIYLPEPLATWRVHAGQQTSRLQNAAAGRREQILFLETCYAKPWIRDAASSRLLFTQIYQLRKQNDRHAEGLARKLTGRISAIRYRQLWLSHKCLTPLRKLACKFTGQNPASRPAV